MLVRLSHSAVLISWESADRNTRYLSSPRKLSWCSCSTGFSTASFRKASPPAGTARAHSDTLVSIAELERLQLAHDVSEVRSLLAELRRNGLGPNRVHFHVAIDHASKRGDWAAALDFFQDLLEQKHTPTVVTYNATMQACDTGKQWGSILELMKAMEGHSVEPNLISFSCAIKASERCKQWQETLNLFEGMQIGGLIPPLPAHRAALSACFHTGQW